MAVTLYRSFYQDFHIKNSLKKNNAKSEVLHPLALVVAK